MRAETGLIRQFQQEDAEACSRLVRECLRLDPLMPPAAKEELIRAESAAAMRERAALFYLAVLPAEDRIAGVGGIDLNEIRLLFVHPEYQHTGMGSRLLEHLESLVPPALFRNAFVYAAPAAAGFYQARGYQAGGEAVFHIGALALPTVFLTKRL
jgi:N-acetylglutamate synthase-like GNAT family acetyltransferase